MKTILESSTKISIYAFDDSKTITLRSNSIIIGDPAEFIIWDLNENNSEIILGVTTPDDWESRKYKYSTSTGVWTLNPEWDTWNDVQDENLQDLLDSKLNISSYTDADVLDKIKRVDGATSGLDADLLDGLHASEFLLAATYSPTDILNKLLTIDGIGSGLDADVLDGKQGSYYLDPENISAIIPVSKLSGLYSINVTGNAGTATNLETERDISLSGDVTGSVTFNGNSDVDIITSLVEFNTNVDANYNRLINLDSPLGLNDAANKHYVDSLVNNVIQLLDRGKSYYVDVEGTDDVTCGKTPATPFRTIKYACERVAAEQAEAGQEFRASIHIGVGTYAEQLPIIVPPFTSLAGDTQRSTVVVPASGLSEEYDIVSTTADSGQTAFYTDTEYDDINVYKNNVLLAETTDYTIHRKKIVLNSPCANNDAIILNNYTENKHNTMFKMSNGTLAIKILIAGMGGWSNEANVAFESTTNTIYLEDHGLVDGDALRIVSAEGALDYLTNKHVFVINSTANTDYFQVSYEVEGDPVEFLEDGVGIIENSDLTTTKPRGVVFALNGDSPIITTSPYILECAHISTYISGSGRAIGAYIDGKAKTSGGAIQTAGTKSMLFHAYTNIIDDGIAFFADNGGVLELVSCFTYYCKAGYASTRGGYIRSLNGSNSWGIRALHSAGYLADEIPITSTIYGEQFYYSFVEAVSNTSAELVPGDFIFSNTSSGAIGTLISDQPIEKKIIYQPVLGQFDYQYEEGSLFSIYANSDVIITSNTEIEPAPGAEPKFIGNIAAEATSTRTPVSNQLGRSIAIYNLQRYNPETGEYGPYTDILKEGASITMNDIIGYDTSNNIVYEEHSYVIQNIKSGGTGIVEEYDSESNTTVEVSSDVVVLGLVQNKEFESLSGWTATMRYKFSQVRCSGHDLLDIGTGNWDTTNLYDPELPSRSANSELEVSEFSPGRVFYVTTDQDGNFKVGNYFEVNQGTGQIYLDASVFDLASVESFEVGILTIGGTNPVSGVSTSVTLSETSNVILPTQRAVKTYVDAEIQSVDDRNLDFEESNIYPINISGNSNTATALETPRYVQLVNDVSGDFIFDGSSNVEVEVTANYGPYVLVGRDISDGYYRDNGILVNWKNTKLNIVTEYIGVGTQLVTAILSSTSEFAPVEGDVVEISSSIGTEEEKLNGRWNVTNVTTDGANTNVQFVIDSTISSGTYSSNVGDIFIAHTGYFGINSTTNNFDYIPNATRSVSWNPSLGAEVINYEGGRGTINADIVGDSITTNTLIAIQSVETDIITAATGIITGDLQVMGSLAVEGDIVSVAVTEMLVEDPRITLGGAGYANGEPILSPAVGRRGIEFWYGTGLGNADMGFFGYDPDEDLFKFISVGAGNSVSEVTGTLDAYVEYSNILNTPNTWISFSDGSNQSVPDSTSDTFTFVAGGGLTTVVSAINDSVTYDHYQPSTNDLTETHRTYVTGLTYDDYGHIISYTTNTESVLDTTYSLSTLDGAANEAIIRITDNNLSNDSISIVGSDNINIDVTGDIITITAPDVDTTIYNDTSNVTQYIVSARAVSGAFTDAYISNNNLYFNPSTGTLSATDFDSLSDVTLKENVKSIGYSKSIINQLVPVEFTWKDNGRKAFGMIAQEVEKILPEIVSTNDKGIKSVAYSQMIPFLVDVVQKQQKEIDELKELIKKIHV